MLLQSFKFKVIICFLFFSGEVLTFSDQECLKSDFQMETSHKGSPFGLTKKILKLKKKGCEIDITHEKLKFLKKSWLIDICRGPIHIKKTKGSIKVLRKNGPCLGQEDSFCREFNELKTIIQDDGLIFAKGDKENLQSNHGKVYCAYLLFKAYLEREIIFSLSKNYENILKEPPPSPTHQARQSQQLHPSQEGSREDNGDVESDNSDDDKDTSRSGRF